MNPPSREDHTRREAGGGPAGEAGEGATAGANKARTIQDGLRRLSFLLGTSVGRANLHRRIFHRIGPYVRKGARLWRRTVVRKVRVIAITGTFGKTTTTAAVQAAVDDGDEGRSLYNLGSGVYLNVLRIKPWHRNVVLEVAIPAPGLASRQIEATRPNVAIVTSIGSEHISAFKTMDNTAKEKSKLVKRLPKDGVAILNGDDARVAAMAALAPCRVVTFGLGEANDVRAENVALDWPRGMRFDLIAGANRRPAFIRLMGIPGVYAALAGAATALDQGVEIDVVVDRLTRMESRAGRLQILTMPNGAQIVRDDFKAPVESFEWAFDLLGRIPARRRIAVIGEFSEGTGERPRDIMRRLGAAAARTADHFMFVGTHTAASAYRAGARAGGLTDDRIHYYRGDLHAYVAALRNLLRPGDVMLLKGRREQKLGRLAIALMGREVRCAIRTCTIPTACEECGLLTRGWENLGEMEAMAMELRGYPSRIRSMESARTGQRPDPPKKSKRGVP